MQKLVLLILVLSSCQSIGKMDVSKWVDLNRFIKANSQLISETTDGRCIVFMGDSITEGWDRHKPDYFKNPKLINRGISGQTSHQMLLRFRQDVIDLKPAMVIINCGINDIDGNAGKYKQKESMNNIKSMCDLARANDIKVVLSSVLPCDDLGLLNTENPSKKIVALNKEIEKYANEVCVRYINYHNAMKTTTNALKEEYTYDGVHPNTEGYIIMEELIENELRLKSN